MFGLKQELTQSLCNHADGFHTRNSMMSFSVL